MTAKTHATAKLNEGFKILLDGISYKLNVAGE